MLARVFVGCATAAAVLADASASDVINASVFNADGVVGGYVMPLGDIKKLEVRY